MLNITRTTFGSRHRRGSNAVEFAITAPMLIALMLGIAEYGLFFGQTIDMVECAQTGAREAAVATSDILDDPDLDANTKAANIEAEGDAACEETQVIKGYEGATCEARIVDITNLGRSIQVRATQDYSPITSGLIPVPGQTSYQATFRLIP